MLELLVPKSMPIAMDMINFRLYRLGHNKVEKKKRNNFLSVYFQAKCIEEVKLASIFRKYADCIPSHFSSADPPTVLYRRSKQIGSTIFNYRQVVDDVITNDWKSNNSHTCNCAKSAFCGVRMSN